MQALQQPFLFSISSCSELHVGMGLWLHVLIFNLVIDLRIIKLEIELLVHAFCTPPFTIHW